MSDNNEIIHDDNIEENVVEENIEKNETETDPSELPPLDVKLNDNPEEVRMEVQASMKEAESLINKELGLPEEIEKQKDEDRLFKNIKIQNTILKICCICLICCTLVNLCLNRPQTNTSNINISAGQNEIGFQEVKPGELMTAAQIYAKNIQSMVAIKTEIVEQSMFGNVSAVGMGSGFIISEDGYVLTNYHVIEKSKSTKVILENGTEYQASLIGYEAENDVAVLKILTDDKFTPVTLGKSQNIIEGEDVVAIGNPLGELTFSITKGIISAVDRTIQLDQYTSINMFQVDCAVNEGNSGGPIFNARGEVIGIVSAKYASDTIEGLGFCIPIDDVTRILPDLIKFGKVMNKPYMGVQVADVVAEMISVYNMVPGAYVSLVEEGSCAETAGLKVGDIIVTLGNKEVESVADLLNAKKSFKAGETTNIQVWRGGEYVMLSITFDKLVEEEPVTEEPAQENTNDNFSIEDYWNYYIGENNK